MRRDMSLIIAIWKRAFAVAAKRSPSRARRRLMQAQAKVRSITHRLTEATFGWAITAHKAQGSQWENVIVWDDGLGKSDLDRRRWLYTAITRAEQGLVILA
jgi:ATP-dependent exoDNAse (exonuclease V) alpha subunit